MEETPTRMATRLETSEELGALALALAKAQAQFPAIPKNKTATIRSRKEGASPYKYNYADIADVLKAVVGPLAANGLAVVQTIETEGNVTTLVSALIHESNQRIVSRLRLTHALADPKEAGAELTYRRRHALCALIGVAADEDTDAQAFESDQGQGRSNGSAVRQPARRSQQAQTDQSDTGELASEGERAFLAKRAGDSLPTLLRSVGATSIDSLTKAQFVKARTALVAGAEA